MNKILVLSLVALVALGANVASAQGYYYPAPSYGSGTAYQSPYSGSCVNLASDLSFGSRGTQVSQLQTFLVNQNFPGGGSWMITGYFGSATLSAVRNFQQQQGLFVSGVVDAATRAAVSRVSCLTGQGGGYAGGYSMYNYNTYPSPFAQGYGGTQYTAPTFSGATYGTYPYTAPLYNYSNTYSSNTNCYYVFPYTCQTYSGVVLTSLSSTSGQPGTGVTIHGSGFDYANNTVYFGMVPLTNLPSYNGATLTFTVPAYSYSGTVGISVVNSRGTSNTLNFSVTSSTAIGCSGVPGYPYAYGSYGYGYCPPSGTTPSITYVSPNSGAVGSSVTVYGSGFSYAGNTVHFGQGIIANVPSYNGTSLTFTVPSVLSGYGSQIVTPGTYNITVSNSAGYSSNAVSFTVTSSGYSGAPVITSVNGPTSLPTGVQGTWTLQVNNPSSSYMTTSVNWGDAGGYASAAAPQATYQQGLNTLTFTHTYYTAGTYTVVFTVTNSSGQSNTASATVNVGSGSYGNVTLSSLSPTSGHVGTQIVITGSGFTPLENTVHFGIGGMRHVPSYNGTTIYYTVPSYVSPCDLVTPGSVCAQYLQPVLPGPYQISVTNLNGTTQTLSFQVQ